MSLSSLHTCKGHKHWGLSPTRASATGRSRDQRSAGAAERLSLRSPAPASERKGGGNAALLHRRARKRRENLSSGRRVLSSSCAVHPSAQRACPRPASRAGGREGDETGLGLLTHHLQPLSRARSKSQDFGFGLCGRGRGANIWGTQLCRGPGPSPSSSPKLPEGGLWTHSQLSIVVTGAAAPPRRITLPAPPCTRGQWSRPRKLSATPRLPAPRVTHQMHSAPIPEGRLFISHQATGQRGILGLVVFARVERTRIEGGN